MRRSEFHFSLQGDGPVRGPVLICSRAAGRHGTVTRQVIYRAAPSGRKGLTGRHEKMTGR